MSVTINIASTDRTSKIEWPSFSLERAMTSQIDTLRFSILRRTGADYKPSMLDVVEVLEGSTKIFGGKIVEMKESVDGMVEKVEVFCKDYTFEMDQKMVIASYEDETVDDIIDDIVTNFLPAGYTMTNVDCPLTVGYIAFNYEYPSKCFQQLAELLNYDWYVDENKDIHFFSKSTKSAPFDLTDTNGKYIYNSLKIKKDLKNLRNVIVVRGGTYQGTLTSEKEVADGTALIYKQGNQYANVFVKVGGVSKTVGVDNIDDPTGYDCLYNFQEKFVRFKTGTKPAASAEVEVGGNPYIPVIVKVKESTSISTYGEYEFKVIDKSISTKQGARDRAKAEITAWAQTINEGGFETVEVGLETGQRINIQSTLRSIDQDYVISRIASRMRSPTEFQHSVQLITTQTFDMVDFLQKLLMSKDKEIEIRQGEVVDEVEATYETITLTDVLITSTSHNPQIETITLADSLTVQALNYAVEFCLGEQAPSGLKRQFVLEGSSLG